MIEILMKLDSNQAHSKMQQHNQVVDSDNSNNRRAPIHPVQLCGVPHIVGDAFHQRGILIWALM